MKKKMLGLICVSLCCLSINIAQAQQISSVTKRAQRYALLIGVNDYAPPLGKLEYCQRDMEELRAHFASAGFAAGNVTLMQDQADDSALRPSKSNIDKQLELRLQLANEDDVVVVAFSGHGLHIDGKSYLCPSDARLDATDSLIPIESIYAQMEKCRTSKKVLIIDACRNEPLVRGFKSARLVDDLAIELRPPPKGLIVLSSCEPRQFSAEDAKLQHGVFMYYLIQGLKGAADTDTEIGGNRNGRVSLDELYYYAHEKTKNHVAGSHRTIQRPVMKGEMVGRLDLALVPDAAKLSELAEPSKLTEPQKIVVPVETAVKIPKPRMVDHPVLAQGDTFLRQANHESAISAYTAVVDDTSLQSEIRNEARKNRGAAYLARGTKADIDKALIDQLAAGLSGIRMMVRAATADLKIGYDVKGKVKRNQIVHITNVNGDWLWVDSVDGSEKLQGYLHKDAVIEPPAAPAQPTYNNNQYYYYYDDE